MDEGLISMRNYSLSMKEKEAKDLKDWKTEFEKIVTLNINTQIDYPKQTFTVRSFVYHPGIHNYVVIKKYDDAKKIYICRPKEEQNKL